MRSGCILQLPGFGESGICFGCAAERLKGNAFVGPGIGKLRIKINADSLIASLDGLIVFALRGKSIPFL